MLDEGEVLVLTGGLEDRLDEEAAAVVVVMEDPLACGPELGRLGIASRVRWRTIRSQKVEKEE